VLNLYRYDYEEFHYEDGRLLLRGNNGSGKSRVLALQLPFLLDGEVSPARVEPDGDAAKRIQELYLSKHKDEAIAAVPDEWVDMKSLVGPPARIKQRFRAWEDSGADSLSVRSRQPAAIEIMAEAARLNSPG